MCRDSLPFPALCGSSAVRLRRCFARRPGRFSRAPGPAPSPWVVPAEKSLLAPVWASSPVPASAHGKPRLFRAAQRAWLGTLRITFPLPSGRAGNPLEISRFRAREPRQTRRFSAPFHQDFFVTVLLPNLAFKH